MSGGEIAALVVAGGWALLVLFLGYVLVRLGGVLEQAGRLVDRVSAETVPLINEVTASVTHVNTELERVDSITANVVDTTGNVKALSAVLAATVGGPLIKVAAFSYGVRRAVGGRRGAG